MSRNAVYSALVLRSRPSGESNNEVSLLTAEEGIIKATVFGGPKSKLRSHSAPYNSGKVWIYRDPAKEYGKLSDFDVQSWRPGLRELYERTMAAAAIAETILYTHGGGGDWGYAMKLAVSTLDALETASEELCPRLLVHFLWRWAQFLGIQPHIEACAACGDRAETNALWYNAREGAAFCANCAGETELNTHGADGWLKPTSIYSPQQTFPAPERLDFSHPHRSAVRLVVPQKSSSVPKNSALSPISAGCRRWLSAVGPLDPSLLNRYSMDNKSFGEAKALTTAIMTAALGKRLASWDW